LPLFSAPALYGRHGNAETLRRLRMGQSAIAIQRPDGSIPAPTETFTLRPCARQSGVNAFLSPRALKLGDRGEHTCDQATCGGAGVDSLAERDECDTPRLPFVEQKNEVSQVPAETIQ